MQAIGTVYPFALFFTPARRASEGKEKKRKEKKRKEKVPPGFPSNAAPIAVGNCGVMRFVSQHLRHAVENSPAKVVSNLHTTPQSPLLKNRIWSQLPWGPVPKPLGFWEA
jgi:hypothetical protein